MKETWRISRGAAACNSCGRKFDPEEEHYSTLYAGEEGLARKDACNTCWTGRPADALCCWKTRQPDPAMRQKPRAHTPALMDLFLEMQRQADGRNPAFVYVVALMLVRKRRLKVEEESGKTLFLSKPSTGERFAVEVPLMSDEDMAETQAKLLDLLDGIQPAGDA